MKILHISDTHGFHNLLTIPEDIDMIIHSGDTTNYKDLYKNQTEMEDFIYWYSRVKVKYKILIAGNHDITLEKNLFNVKQTLKDNNIIYLENESVTIESIKIWGSPYTPTFGDWSFMKARHKLGKIWSTIPDDTDIVIVHGPPKGIMDSSFDFNNYIERCGCNALKKRILQVEPKLFLSGHIHNSNDIINAGTLKLSAYRTIFSNGSVVTDGKFGTLSSQGNILEI